MPTASTTSSSRRPRRKASCCSRTSRTRRTRAGESFATPPQAIGGEALSTDVVVVDLDRDGDLDIVTAAGIGAPDRAFINAGGAFTSTALGLATVDSRAVAAGDINGDAFVDLVFANSGTSAVLINTGSGAAFTAGRRHRSARCARRAARRFVRRRAAGARARQRRRRRRRVSQHARRVHARNDAGNGPHERRGHRRLQRRQPRRPRVRARHRDAARGAERARVAEHLGQRAASSSSPTSSARPRRRRCSSATSTSTHAPTCSP